MAKADKLKFRKYHPDAKKAMDMNSYYNQQRCKDRPIGVRDYPEQPGAYPGHDRLIYDWMAWHGVDDTVPEYFDEAKNLFNNARGASSSGVLWPLTHLKTLNLENGDPLDLYDFSGHLRRGEADTMPPDVKYAYDWMMSRHDRWKPGQYRGRDSQNNPMLWNLPCLMAVAHSLEIGWILFLESVRDALNEFRQLHAVFRISRKPDLRDIDWMIRHYHCRHEPDGEKFGLHGAFFKLRWHEAPCFPQDGPLLDYSTSTNLIADGIYYNGQWETKMYYMPHWAERQHEPVATHKLIYHVSTFMDILDDVEEGYFHAMQADESFAWSIPSTRVT